MMRLSDFIMMILTALRQRYITAILITPSVTRYPEYRAAIQYSGCLLSAVGILASGFVTQPWHLVVTSGLLYPVGGAMVYLPAATLLFEWFQQKRGLANGIMYSGAGKAIYSSGLPRFASPLADIPLQD